MGDSDIKIKKALLNTTPSIFWKKLVEIFLSTLTEKEQNNFKLASNKFAIKEPHLYIKDVPWFKEWYKQNYLKYVDDNDE